MATKPNYGGLKNPDLSDEKRSKSELLTWVQAEMLELMEQGLDNEEIAKRLGLTRATTTLMAHNIRTILERNPSAYRTILSFSLIEYSLSETINSAPPLTPFYLEQQVLPVLKAIANIQQVSDDIRGKKDRASIRIGRISQHSPINIGMEGVSNTVEILRETLTPWRRKHAESMAKLAEQEKLAEIEFKKAEILESRVRASQGREEAKKLLAEVRRQEEETKRLALENEKLKLDLERARVQLVLDILAELGQNLSEQERITYVVRLIQPIMVLTDSNLEILSHKKINR
jgi:hypothetical protein